MNWYRTTTSIGVSLLMCAGVALAEEPGPLDLAFADAIARVTTTTYAANDIDLEAEDDATSLEMEFENELEVTRIRVNSPSVLDQLEQSALMFGGMVDNSLLLEARGLDVLRLEGTAAQVSAAYPVATALTDPALRSFLSLALSQGTEQLLITNRKTGPAYQTVMSMFAGLQDELDEDELQAIVNTTDRLVIRNTDDNMILDIEKTDRGARMSSYVGSPSAALQGFGVAPSAPSSPAPSGGLSSAVGAPLGQ